MCLKSLRKLRSNFGYIFNACQIVQGQRGYLSSSAASAQISSDKVIQQPSFLPTSFLRSTNLTAIASPLLVCTVTGRMTLPRSVVVEGPRSNPCAPISCPKTFWNRPLQDIIPASSKESINGMPSAALLFGAHTSQTESMVVTIIVSALRST